MTVLSPASSRAATPSAASSPQRPVPPPAPPQRPSRLGAGGAASGIAVVVGLLVAVGVVGLWHLSQGTSRVGLAGLVEALLGGRNAVGGVPVADIFSDSRLPRLVAGSAVGISLGVAGALLQSATRNQLASPDTLAVASGAHFGMTASAALAPALGLGAMGAAVPLWASGSTAFLGGLAAAAVVLGLSGRAAGTRTTRIVLAGSAVAMALDAGTGMLLILFKERTKGLYAWGNGSLAQLNIDASLRAAPVIVVVLCAAMLLCRRLDVLGLGEDTAASLGVPVRSTRMLAVGAAVVLTAASVTLAGPIAFIGLGAPVLARLLGSRVRSLNRHVLLLPVSGLLGALLILLADAALRAVLTPSGAAAIPTGVPTAMLGGLVIVVLALRLRDAGGGSGARPAGTQGPHPALRSRRRFVVVLSVGAVLLVAAAVAGMLSGTLQLRLGDVGLWLGGRAHPLIAGALDERLPRVLAACLAGAALGLAGTVVQGTVRNPLAEPGVLGITAGAGFGAALVTSLLGGGRGLLVAAALVCGLATFAVVTGLSWRGGFLPDRFVLTGIGLGYTLTAATTFLLLSVDPWETPRLLTWLSGTTYGRTLPDVAPVAIGLVVAVPVLAGMRRELDLLAIDEDTPRILGVNASHARLAALSVAAALAAVSVVAVGVVGFVGLIAPHMARALVGSAHRRVIPVAMVIGAVLVCLADTLGRVLISPAQIPAGLMIALVGAPYFVYLLRRTRA